MSFFDSEVVRSELVEISELQEQVYKNVFTFYMMNKSEKINHVNILQKLLEKQRILYTRMSLSDDPEAQKMKQNILDSAKMMGLDEQTDISYMFGNIEKVLEKMKEDIDKRTDS